MSGLEVLRFDKLELPFFPYRMAMFHCLLIVLIWNIIFLHFHVVRLFFRMGGQFRPYTWDVSCT